jgi:hypothetical protein
MAFWYPLHPPFTTTEEDIHTLAANRAAYRFLISLAQYAVLAWQLGFPLFAWRAGRSRVPLLAGAGLGWLGCWYIYQTPLFGPIWVIGCLSYLRPEEWLWMRTRLALAVNRERTKPA